MANNNGDMGRIIKSDEVLAAASTITRDIHESISEQYILVALRYYRSRDAFIEFILQSVQRILERAMIKFNTELLHKRSKE
jgi:hypothetical protein